MVEAKTLIDPIQPVMNLESRRWGINQRSFSLCVSEPILLKLWSKNSLEAGVQCQSAVPAKSRLNGPYMIIYRNVCVLPNRILQLLSLNGSVTARSSFQLAAAVSKVCHGDIFPSYTDPASGTPPYLFRASPDGHEPPSGWRENSSR